MVESLFPWSKEKARQIVEIGAILKNSRSILFIKEDYREEPFSSQLKVVVALGFPRGVYPPDQGIFCGPNPHKFTYESAFFQVLNVFSNSFRVDLQLWDCLGFRDTLPILLVP